ncbi:MAG: 2-hydroxychromene-2-carboxylate isomerase [Sandaracinaceae bacterium]
MTASVACWFDYASPYAYLGTARVEAVATRTGAEVQFEPFLLGALFKRVGTPIVPMRAYPAAKSRHLAADLYRYADVYEVPFRFTTHFPIHTVSALRLTLAAPDALRTPLVHRLMRAAWVEDRPLADVEVLTACAEEVGLPESALEAVTTPAIKQRLREQTERAIDLGMPGAPCFVVGEHVYWGQDRLQLVARALEGRPPRESP